ncbi:AMP-binding protein [Pseudomonadota bacterium]
MNHAMAAAVEGQPWLLDSTQSLDRFAFCGLAHAWANKLPNKRYMILLAEQRRNFIVAFAAAQLAGQTVLLPSNRTDGALAEIAADFPDSYCLTDDGRQFDYVHSVASHALPQQSGLDSQGLVIDEAHVAAIVFTSGSTGKAQPNEKTWGSLVTGAHLAQQRFCIDTQSSIVATVPSQHMYGLETTVMVPLIIGASVHSGRPFFPEDVRLALAACEGERVLITTPVHLRACVAAGLKWPKLKQIICATAPLDTSLRSLAEQVFDAPVHEIYGCTEAGSLASRQQSLSDEWQLYDTFTISEQGNEAEVNAPHLDEPVELGDVVKVLSPTRFRLQGRKADLLNIAGKRASLNDLNLKLNSIKGVEDAVFVMPDGASSSRNPRLAALVVAPGMNAADINESLAIQIDPVFLPRPLYLVDRLPRNETGKLPRQALLNMLASLGISK